MARHRVIFLGDIVQRMHVAQEGYALEFWPSRFPLRGAADAMLLLARPSPITLLGRR